jgi:hypothetical protein
MVIGKEGCIVLHFLLSRGAKMNRLQVGLQVGTLRTRHSLMDLETISILGCCVGSAIFGHTPGKGSEGSQVVVTRTASLLEIQVVSDDGKGGGIKIARTPTDINLSEIYTAATEQKKLLVL